ncbi:MAG TPA: arsenate reductase ArsC [Acidimicrobiales bacterium]
MAEALLVHRSGGTCDARSAGSHPKPLHPQAVATMAARGIDIAGRASKHLDRFRTMRFDRVITLCDKVREVCPEFPGAADTAHWSVPDPATQPPEHLARAFEATADELSERIDFLICELVES